MSKRQQNGKLSNVVLSLHSLQQQMLLVTREISMTIAVYQVQGHSESSAMTVQVEFLRSCLNILWQKDKCLLEKEDIQFHASDFFLLCHRG